MEKKNKKTIGILGGMGPLATCDLMHKIIDLTDARTDQEHFHILVDCNTDIPDRTAAILSGGSSPVPQMVRSALRLQEMGADFLVMSCNTAHYFYEDIQSQIHIPMLHMIRETAAQMKKQGIRRAGLLATDGTVQSGVYARAVAEAGIELLVPDEDGQLDVMQVIYDGVKAGNTDLDVSDFARTCDSLLAQGAQMLILGCTELPLAMEMYALQYPCIDPTYVLAQAAVRFGMSEDMA